MGMWTIVATLIHELAHVNGAGGVNNDAEKTLKGCLMKQHYDPHIVGQILRAPSNLLLASMNRSRTSGIES